MDTEALKRGIWIKPATPAQIAYRARQADEEFQAKSAAERAKAFRARKTKNRLENIAVLDMETDPFDNVNQAEILPFLAVLYSDNFEPIIIWEEDKFAFARAVVAAIEGLPDQYTIYAHNGGKFDFMFLIHELRGNVAFKGRGIMKATIGNHELRDSFHIIPEKLAAYQKDVFDYNHLKRDRRHKHRQEIIDYCLADCKYLLDIVKGFVKEFGFKLSIGGAALTELRKHYKYETLSSSMDEMLRPYFFGGRVECLAGLGKFQGHYKLYDVNSMYPAAMANVQHPIGNRYTTRIGEPSKFTCFLDINCKNDGALVARRQNSEGQWETTTGVKEGRFFTTIHEYTAALELGLISDVEINLIIDNNKMTDFSKFVVPNYERRQELKVILKDMAARKVDTSSFAYLDVKKDDIFRKLLLNNAYGKFAQNPRRYKETCLTEPGELPEGEGWSDFPLFSSDRYSIWERPTPKQRFNNVGTAASITGACRAILMRAIAGATDPIYCDTDSVICRDISGVELDPVKLGAWDLEAEFSEVIVNGKKLYACQPLEGGDPKIKSKGVAGLTYEDMNRIYQGEVLEKVAKGATLTRTGHQHYVTRRVRATAKQREENENAYGSRRVKQPVAG